MEDEARLLTDVLRTSVHKWRDLGSKAQAEIGKSSSSAAVATRDENVEGIEEDENESVTPVGVAESLAHLLHSGAAREDSDDEGGSDADEQNAGDDVEDWVYCDASNHVGDRWLHFTKEQQLASGTLDLDAVKETPEYTCQE